ncbi:hypothetical protein C5U48_12850 [Mycolicibacter virginiensis]|uniref:Uncharacterized protein n=1 Tax=Mycolicibacter virginiensis TaxID=1795032 RepID=A0A9X7IMR1_9MYCO|nr:MULTISPECIES: hypothetical protein [Mycobacteriaceae]PQM51809.1 hypothetical protein C5U48_12850 [Mycolicibacter virginiensis]
MPLDEVTIDMEAGTAWGIPIGDGRDDSPAVVIFHADDVAVALRDEQVHWPSLDSMTVTPAGFATVHRRRDGRMFIFELFPARWGDGDPYQPLVYVGRWPD